MEPVIKKSPYHHVLLMRDDKEVVSFKVHSKVLWYSLACSIILVTLGLTGTIYGVKTWQRYHSLRAKYQATSTELVEARLQLEQLSNLQTLIATSDSPAPVFKFNEIQMPLQREANSPQENEADEGVQAVGEASAATDAKNGDSNEETPGNSAHSSASATTPTNQQTNERTSSNNTDSTADSPGSPDSSGSAGKNTSAVEGQPSETATAITNQGGAQGTAQTLLITDEASPVRINNLLSKPANQNRIQLSFDLVTNKQDAFVRGETTYQIELQDGAIHDIKPNFLDDSRFAISRMKNFDLTATLPKGIKDAQIKNILISVTLDSGEVFSASYPFAP